VGSAKGEQTALNARARQNVILELGYFIGRLGRDRVCAIVRSKLELPSDLHGIAYLPFDGESWKLQIVRELRALGIDVDANSMF
jgi:predicted nucleotide-binding protein